MKEANIIFESFGLILKILHAIGIYTSEKESLLFKLWAYGLYFFLGSLTILLIIVNVFLQENTNITERNFMCIFIFEISFCALKVLPFITKGYKVHKCIYYFAEDRFLPQNDEERKILEDCLKFCKMICRIFLTDICLAVVLWCSPSLFSQAYSKVPLDVWLPYNVSSGPEVYYPTWVFLAVADAYNGFSGILIDPILAGLLYYTIAHLKILKYNLENLDKFLEKEWSSEQSEVISYCSVEKVLTRCILLQNDILNFMEEYKGCFSWSLFFQMTGSMLCLCFCCFGLSITTFGTVDFFKVVVCTFVTISEIFFFCYFGTLLFEESNGIRDAIYFGPWYRYDIQVRKTLIIMMEGSKKPVEMMAGNFIRLNLSVFASTLKSSYSLLTVLKNRQQLN